MDLGLWIPNNHESIMNDFKRNLLFLNADFHDARYT